MTINIEGNLALIYLHFFIPYMWCIYKSDIKMDFKTFDYYINTNSNTIDCVFWQNPFQFILVYLSDSANKV
jgi:hypothetical protein